MVVSANNDSVSYATGIPANTMDYFAAMQIGDQWCWAAAIQMVLNYYGIAIGQDQIVAKTHGMFLNGDLPNLPATYQNIHNNLNYWGYDNFRKRYAVKGEFYSGCPDASWLINELCKEHPVIVITKVDEETLHAVVITGVEYYQIKDRVIIQKIIVRDPWPNAENEANYGRVELNGNRATAFQAFWSVRVS